MQACELSLTRSMHSAARPEGEQARRGPSATHAGGRRTIEAVRPTGNTDRVHARVEADGAPSAVPAWADDVIEPLQVVAAALVAAFPWALGLDVLTPTFENWIAWVAMVGAQALMMLARRGVGWSRRSRCWRCSACASSMPWRCTGGWWRIISGGTSLSSRCGSRRPCAACSARPSRGIEEGPFSYFMLYFDPVVPLVNMLLRLTDDPVRLLGFQLVAVVAAPIAVWWICVREATLKSVHLLLPVALLVHPSLVGPLQLDYHTSTIGLALILIGSYAFWMNRHHAAFWCLLLGTLTKVSYWPSWLVFGMVHGMRRRWVTAALYGAIGVAALVVYTQLQAQRPQGALGIGPGSATSARRMRRSPSTPS